MTDNGKMSGEVEAASSTGFFYFCLAQRAIDRAKERERELVASEERERRVRWEGVSSPPHDPLRPLLIS